MNTRETTNNPSYV